ncbi:MAG TPA: DNA-directed RNA polymerase subunit omega [Deinococcales bacterium]|nr:DNA-directed RNA polymerase subunit omega [Deinococcales bacterium]
MAERNIDRLLSQTDSKYRLSVVIAKRALQLKAGVAPVIPAEARANTRNLVTVAMREMATGTLEHGDGIVDENRLNTTLERTRAQVQESQMAAQNAANSFTMPDFED